MIRRSKKPLGSGDEEYFNEKRLVNVRVDGTGAVAEVGSGVVILSAAAGSQRGGVAFATLGFFGVEMLVGFGEQLLDPFSVASIDRNANAGGERWFFLIAGENLADAAGNEFGFGLACFWEHQGKLVAAVAGGGVDGAAVDAQGVGKTADGAAANEVAVSVVDFLQAVEIEEQNGEGPAGAIGALGFAFEDVEEPAVVGQAG
jgi:hypothetical protein